MAETTFYIDHSVVTREAWWPYLRRAVSDDGCKIVLSVWNLFEIGAASDQAQQSARLAFFESLNPLWAVDRRSLQKQEVKRFLWNHKFGLQPDDLIAITASFSVANYFLSGPLTVIGETPKQFISGIDFETLNPLKKLSPAAQTTLKAVDRAALKRKEPEIFTGWIGQSVPLWAPDGKPFTREERADLAGWCYERRKQFLWECPSLAVEDAITADRSRDRARKPIETDGPDLEHTAVGLAYCDIFCTGDGYQANSADAARRMLSGFRLADVCRTPEEFEHLARTSGQNKAAAGASGRIG
jgi:hypothetical protein